MWIYKDTDGTDSSEFLTHTKKMTTYNIQIISEKSCFKLGRDLQVSEIFILYHL